ncbi:MAG: MFS transporter [Bacteroidaceae bacterium]|nr:MFS transporter [Bacteroidaceae bacterium]MBP5323458.1 MFS transporter [Bacteroidaceae bacterium]
MKNKKLIPVMLCFFAMGFVDLVGIASNYVKADLNLSDSMANLLPSLVFFWFLIFSIPTSLLMNRIGRKRTVLLSLVITIVSMLIPIFAHQFWLLLIAFSLLGIGNALMQTSLNPLVDSVMNGGKLASTLTFGQFIKAIASFMAPLIAAWGAAGNIPAFGLGWRVLFPIYMAIGIVATLLLYATKIHEEPAAVSQAGVGKQYANAFRLLANPVVLLCFLAIVCHVGIDVGTNTTAPKVLMERLGWTIGQAAFATSLYFIFRTVGSLLGSFILAHVKEWKFLLISILLMFVSLIGLFVGSSQWELYGAIALMGLGNSNPFSIIMSRALRAVPGKENEVSGLMIMGLFGGTVFPLLMGFASDRVGQAGAIAVMALGVLYLLAFWFSGTRQRS